MKRIILVTLFLSFFGFSSSVLAYDTCDPHYPIVPCTYNSVDYTSFIGNNNQNAVFLNVTSETVITYDGGTCSDSSDYTCIDLGISNGFNNVGIAFLGPNLTYWGLFNGAGIAHNGVFIAFDSIFVTGYQELGDVINPSKNLIISRSPELSGGVSDYPAGENILCGIDSYEVCEASFSLNTEVTLDASPNEGYAFSHWEINDLAMADVDGSIDVTMSEAKNVVAVFKKTFLCTNGSFQSTSGTGGWCVDYVNSETGVNLSGNASEWWQGAIDAGYATGSDPAISAIVVLDDSSLAYGHVGIVTDFNETTIWVQDSNWSDPYDFQIRNYTLSRSRSDISGYIYCAPQN